MRYASLDHCPPVQRHRNKLLALHDQIITWYCVDSRAGADGRIQAEEGVQSGADRWHAPLLRLSRREQKLTEDLISGVGDMAKSLFVTGILSTNDGPGWSLPIAESSTGESETIHAVLNLAVAVRSQEVDCEPLFVQILEIVPLATFSPPLGFSKRDASGTKGWGPKPPIGEHSHVLPVLLPWHFAPGSRQTGHQIQRQRSGPRQHFAPNSLRPTPNELA